MAKSNDNTPCSCTSNPTPDPKPPQKRLANHFAGRGDYNPDTGKFDDPAMGSAQLANTDAFREAID